MKRAQGCCKIEDHDAGEWGAIGPGAKATGQTQRRDEPQNEDLDDSGSGMRRMAQRSPQSSSSPPQVWSPKMAASVPRVGQEGT